MSLTQPWGDALCLDRSIAEWLRLLYPSVREVPRFFALTFYDIDDLLRRPRFREALRRRLSDPTNTGYLPGTYPVPTGDTSDNILDTSGYTR